MNQRMSYREALISTMLGWGFFASGALISIIARPSSWWTVINLAMLVFIFWGYLIPAWNTYRDLKRERSSIVGVGIAPPESISHFKNTFDDSMNKINRREDD